MVLKIRLQRFGTKRAPFYHIVCINARTARNSKPLEKLGTYDPIPKNGNKDISLNFERTKYWLGVGAHPTETMGRLLEKANLYTRKPRPWMKYAADKLATQEQGTDGKMSTEEAGPDAAATLASSATTTTTTTKNSELS